MKYIAWGFFLLTFLLPAAKGVELTADYVIEGATLLDGSGEPARHGKIAIQGDRIVGIGTFKLSNKPKSIQARGLIAAPGFIDLHNHSDNGDDGEKPPILDPSSRENLNFLYQGVTTIVTGNCGAGELDVGDFLKRVDQTGTGTNVAHLIPHNELRRKVMGNANREPTPAELGEMKRIVESGMRAGAWGMSTGLYYTPGNFSKIDELVELSRVVAAHGGIYASHIRDEGYQLKESVAEAIEIGKRSGAPIHISHLKADRFAVWGKGKEAVGWIADARREGLKVTADQYPYTAASTWLSAELIPSKYRSGDPKEWLKRLEDPASRAALKKEMATILADYEGGKQIWIAEYKAKPGWQGKDLVALARAQGKEVFDLVMEIESNGGAGAIYFCMGDDDVDHIMKQPFVATASDGYARSRTPSTSSHPRSYGSFPRKIGHYSLERKVVPLPFAVRSASGLPADIMGLRDRGYLKVGYRADVVLFDPRTFRDTATYLKPHEQSKGVRYLFLNGKAVIEKGKYTGILAGKALRAEGKRRLVPEVPREEGKSLRLLGSVDGE